MAAKKPVSFKGITNPLIGGAIDIGLGLAMGQSIGDAARTAAGELVGWYIAPHLMSAKLAYNIYKPIADGLVAANKNAHMNRAFATNYTFNVNNRRFNDTEQRANMRMRGLEAIQESRSNATNAVSREASMMHQGSALPPYMRTQRIGW